MDEYNYEVEIDGNDEVLSIYRYKMGSVAEEYDGETGEWKMSLDALDARYGYKFTFSRTEDQVKAIIDKIQKRHKNSK